MPRAPRSDVLALSALGAVAAVGIGLLIGRSAHSGMTNPLAAVPSDAFLIVTVDLPSLAQSPLGASLVGGDAGTRASAALGVDSIASTCGFDPLPHLRSIAFAMPESVPGDTEFGVAISSTLGKDTLASCAKALIVKAGGDPKTRTEGSFTVVTDERFAKGEIAYREGGPYLVGKGPWLAKMIASADGHAPSTLSSPPEVHASLRADLASRDVDAEALRATILLPRPLRAQIEREMALEAREGDRGTQAMEGVLGVSSAAFAIHAGRADEDTRFLAELRCDTEAQCDAVTTFILHTRLGWSGNLAYRFLGLGQLIDNLEAHREGTSVYVRTHAPTGDLAKVLDRLLQPRPPSPSPQAGRGGR